MIESLRNRPLLGMLGIIVAVLAWTAADAWVVERQALEQRKATAARLLARHSLQEGQGAAIAGLAARTQRDELLQRLRLDEGLETARARVYYELREHCAAVKLSCSIRLADSGSAAGARAGGAGTGTEVTEAGSLEALGIQRLRAQVSGSLAEQDITALLLVLSGDAAAQWRIKQLQLRGRGFELDVERLLVPAGGAGQRSGS